MILIIGNKSPESEISGSLKNLKLGEIGL